MRLRDRCNCTYPSLREEQELCLAIKKDILKGGYLAISAMNGSMSRYFLTLSFFILLIPLSGSILMSNDALLLLSLGMESTGV